MPKLKDYFLKLPNQGKFESDDLKKFADALPDIDMPDAVVSSIEENFLTVERAKNDPRIEKHARALALNGVDAWITELTGVDVSIAQDFGGETDTFKKLKLIKNKYKDTLEKAKTAAHVDTSDKDKKISDLTASVETLTSKITEINTQAAKSIADKEKEFMLKLSGVELDNTITELISTYTLADEYNDTARRKRAIKFILAEAKEGNNLSLKDGEIHVWEDPEHTKPKFNGNSVIQFKELLDKAAEPYLKKNSSGDNAPKKREVQNAEPLTGRETLAQIRARNAAKIQI